MGQSYMGRRLVWQGMDVTQKTRHREPRGRRGRDRDLGLKITEKAAIWCPKSSRQSSFARSIFFSHLAFE